MLTICQWCNKEFESCPARKQKYCSRACAGLSRRKVQRPSPKFCVNCGTEIDDRGRPSELEGRKFCSQDCRYTYQKGVNHPRYNPKAHIIASCEQCGKEFRYYKVSNHRGRFCSKVCVGEHRHKTGFVKGNNNPHWKGDTRSRPVLTQFAQRHLPHKCAICGWDICMCDTHHIVPVSEGGPNSIKNVIMLCPNHHRLANRDLISRGDLKEIWTHRYGDISFPE